MLRISMKSSLAQPLPNLSWNVLLTAEHAARKAQHHEPGPRARHRDKLREELVMLMGNCIGGETDIEIATTIDMIHVNASWLGVPFDDLEQEHFEQIIWELHEVNFRYEFHALDQRARYGTPYSDDPHVESLLLHASQTAHSVSQC